MTSGQQKSTPAPLETGEGKQKDDNIDDLGHRKDGTEQDQPVNPSDAGEKHKRGQSQGQ